MKKSIYTVSLAIFLILLYSCSENEQFSEIGQTTITTKDKDKSIYLPFEDLSILKGFESDPKILEYNRVRKLALLELIGTGFDEEMKWLGYRLSKIPIVLYGFDNKPKYYDFIVLDAENSPVGTVTVYARKTASTVIKAVSEEIKDYNSLLSKASINMDRASLFVDWAGNSYAGLLGKSGDQPIQAINIETGEIAESIEEIEGQQIITEMKKEVLPGLLPKDLSVFDDVEETEENKDLLEEVEAAKTLTVEVLADSMKVAYEQDIKNTEAFWTELESETSNINEIDDSEILDGNGKSIFSRLFRRIFSGVDSKTRYLDRYVNSGSYSGASGTKWCGPWACGYVLYVKTSENKYKYFEDCASTYGELGILNFALRLFGRPMTPAEMSWSMPIASKGKVRISPFLWFTDFAAYDQIKHYNKPALRLCSKGSSLHWTVAYGTYQSGNYFWRNYYFLQQDNSSQGGYKNPNNKSNYSRVDWWNPWLMVWD